MRHSIPIVMLAVMFALTGCAGPTGSPAASMDQSTLKSGLQKGDDIESWNPIHVAGPNKGTNACPVCTYLARPAVVIFTKDGPNAASLATKLQDLVRQNQNRQLKGFVIVLDSTPEHLKQMADDLKFTQIGLCYPDPARRDHDLQLYKINPAAANTVIYYKDYKVQANFVNLDAADFEQLVAVVNAVN